MVKCMEDRGSLSPQHTDPAGLSSSPNFAAFFQRASMVPQDSSQSALNQSSEGSHPGPYAPAPLRLTSIPAVALSSNHNQAASPFSDGPIPVTPHLASGIHDMTAQSLKKKRGRPRKYEGTAGNISSTLPPRPSAEGPLSPTTEKRRGRPSGSGKKQQLAALGAWLAGSAGQSFTPHVLTIAAGEDVSTKIMSFSYTGRRAVCVLSANGAISNVTLRQPASSGGTVTYEGRFEILSLSGSFLLMENGGTRSRTGGLSVSLAGPDGRVVGGGVAGMLMAASPVQVVVGSFISEGRKTHTRMTSGASEHAVSLSSSGLGVQSTLVTPLSVVHHLKAETFTPKNPSPPLGANGGATRDIVHSQGQGMTLTQAMSWAGSQSMSESRNDRD